MAESHNLPIMLGDFNGVQEAVDTMANYRAKVCRSLADFLTSFPAINSFRFCHPGDREYTLRRPGVAPSRLDRAYVPGTHLPLIGAVCQVPTTSDHSALCLSFKGSLAAALPASPPPGVLLEVQPLSGDGAGFWSSFSGSEAGIASGEASKFVLG
jgi:hypothetical protein